MKSQLVPGVSLSGIPLGATEAQTRAHLGEPQRVQTKGERSTVLYYRGLHVTFRDDAALMLVADEPAIHETPEGIRVGTPWSELERILPDNVYDEDDGLWYSPSMPGVWYQAARPAYDNEQPIDPPYVTGGYEVHDERAFVRRMFVMRPKDER